MRKLTMENNWESYTYFADGVEIKPSSIKRVFINEKEYAVQRISTQGSYSDWGRITTGVPRIELLITLDGFFQINLSDEMQYMNNIEHLNEFDVYLIE
jgi:hypothetical protein